jgi:hypothetical protein
VCDEIGRPISGADAFDTSTVNWMPCDSFQLLSTVVDVSGRTVNPSSCVLSDVAFGRSDVLLISFVSSPSRPMI